MKNKTDILYLIVFCFVLSLVSTFVCFFFKGTIIDVNYDNGIALANKDDKNQSNASVIILNNSISTPIIDTSEELLNKEESVDKVLSALPSVLPEEIIEEEKNNTIQNNNVSNYKLREDIPLSKEVQYKIFELCEIYKIPPEIAFAVIERESRYKVEIIGDKNQTYHSYGLMQIKLHYVKDIMRELNCTDLLDPIDNVTVGLYVLNQRIEQYEKKYPGYGLECGLRAYNKGSCSGVEDALSARYVVETLQRAEELKQG